jgi:hypothetical protein
MTKCEINRQAKALYCYEYRGRYCSKCGLDSFENPWLMDFHHINPEEKEYTISHKIRTSNFSKIKDELDKCILLCSHCHRTLHAEENLHKYKNNIDKISDKLEHIRKNGGVGKIKDGLWKKYKKDDILLYVNEGNTAKEISKLLNEPYRAICAMLQKYEIQTITGKRPRLNDIDSIIRDYTKFLWGIKRISIKFKKTEKEIEKILIDNKIEIRNNSKKIDIDKLKELLDSNIPKTKICKILNFSENSVYRVIKKNNL